MYTLNDECIERIMFLYRYVALEGTVQSFC